MLNLKANYF